MRHRSRRNRGVACNGFRCDAHSSTVDQTSSRCELTPDARRDTSAGPMKRQLVVLLALWFGIGFASPVWADDEEQGQEEHPPAAEHKADEPEHPPAADHAAPAGGDEQHAPAGEEHKAPDGDADHDGTPDSKEHAGAADGDADHDGTPDSQEHAADASHDSDGDGVSEGDEAKPGADGDADEDDVPYNKFDLDGDGKSDPALEKEWSETTAGLSAKIDEAAVDAALDARPEDQELAPSISADQFRKVV